MATEPTKPTVPRAPLDPPTTQKPRPGNDEKLVLKPPKGTKDYGPTEQSLRQRMIWQLTQVFKLHGGVPIDTPAFELKAILTNKYGEDSKLIYDLADQGGEETALRYDLTVPFARYCATSGTKNIKRYQIGKVWRRDQPAVRQGRLREFYQCDFDIAGEYGPMMADAEVLSILVECITQLEVGDFEVKLNHRELLLQGLFKNIAEVPEHLWKTISSAVDKLDKLSWESVKEEMISKGLDATKADKLKPYLEISGQGKEVISKLREDTQLLKTAEAKQAVEDLELVWEYCQAFGIGSKLKLDLSLARGLDYYTGLIFETKLTKNTLGVGSIASGGRYDGLVGMFLGPSRKGGPPPKIPCVGFSVGLERIFAVLLDRSKKEKETTESETKVYVMNVGAALVQERFEILRELWDAGISAECMYKVKPKLGAQFNHTEKDRIPYGVMIGPDEVERGQVKIKYLLEKSGEETVDRKDLVPVLKEKLRKN